MNLWQEHCTGLLRYFIGLQKGSPFRTEDFIDWVEKTYPVSFPKPKDRMGYTKVILSAVGNGMLAPQDYGNWVGK